MRSMWRTCAPITLVMSVIVALVGVFGVAPAFASDITSSGPLTLVSISPDLNCNVNHSGDSAPEFFNATACGTLLAVGGTLYGPANIPAGGSAAPRTTWTGVSQTAVTGTGTNADPYTIVTVADAGTTGVEITQTDSYVVGEETYRTDVTVSNAGDSAQDAVLYRAGDCYLQNSDFGYGEYDSGTGAVSCVTSLDPGSRIEQFFPLSPGSNYVEDFYDTMWADIGTQQPFPDTCTCSSNLDNSAGLSWSISIPAHGSTTRSNLTVFSPLGNEPLSTTKTADSSTATANGSDGYTITIHNPNVSDVTLNAITDTLPSGFSYTAGSTTGATTVDPSITGQNLSWAGPVTDPAGGDVSLHFDVTVSSVSGAYYNNAGGDAGGSYTVAPTGDTAEVTVSGGGGDTTPPTCFYEKVKEGPAEQLQVGWEDNGSGLASVVPTTNTNDKVKVEPFTSGATHVVHVWATKLDSRKPSTETLQATDVDGNVASCYFAFFEVTGHHTQTVTGVDRADHFINIVNFGLPGLTYTVNGTDHAKQLRRNQDKVIDARKSFTLTSNTFSVTAGCKGLADVVLWDGNTARPGPAALDAKTTPGWCTP